MDVGDVRLDNGLEINIAERQSLIDAKNDLIKGRKRGMEYKETAQSEWILWTTHLIKESN